MANDNETEVSTVLLESPSVGGHTDSAPDTAPDSDAHTETRVTRRWPTINGCRVSVSITIPDSTKYILANDVTAQLLKVLDGRCPALAVGRFRITTAFLTKATAPVEALAEAQLLIPELINILGRESHAAYDIWLGLPEADYPEDADPHADIVFDGVGVGEAADILGVSKQRVHQLVHAPQFPDPVFRLKATPVWRRHDIERYASSRSVRATQWSKAAATRRAAALTSVNE